MNAGHARLKILLCSFQEVERENNGVACHIKDLRQALRAQGHGVTLVTPYQGGEPFIWWRRLRQWFQWLYKKTHWSIWYYLKLTALQFQLKAKIKELCQDYDLIQSNDLISAAAAYQASRAKKPNLLTCHFWEMPWQEFVQAGFVRSGSWGFRWLKKKFLKTLRHPKIHLVSVSKANQKLLNQAFEGRTAKISRVILLGISPPDEIPEMSSDDLMQQDLPQDFILNVGKIEPRKNQRFLIEVARELKSTMPQLGFLLAGPAERQELAHLKKKISEYELEDQVKLLGPMSRERVFALMKAAKLYLHTSLQESFGMVLLEAISMDTPVMALDYEALHEIFPDVDEVYLNPKTTPLEVAQKITQFFEDPALRTQLREKEKACYEQKFTVSRMRQDFEAFYHQLLPSQQSTSPQDATELDVKRA